MQVTKKHRTTILYLLYKIRNNLQGLDSAVLGTNPLKSHQLFYLGDLSTKQKIQGDENIIKKQNTFINEPHIT